MADSVVVDTCVLIHATDNDENGDDFIDCLSIILNFIKQNKFKFGVDCNYEIMSEYEQQIKYRKDHVADLIRDHVINKTRSDQSSIVSSIIPEPESNVEELAEMGFHSSDMIFIRVGPNSDSQIIVSTDGESICNEQYKEWVENNMEVNIMKPDEFVELL